MALQLSRRSLLALAAAAPLAAKPKNVPVGLELYSVREDLSKDFEGTVRAVAKQGYDGVEFFGPYFQWTPERAKEVRKLIDDLGLKCLSTHNGRPNFTAENLKKAIELNQILGSKLIVMSSGGRVENLDGWNKVADELNAAAATLKPLGMRTGFHNHRVEFQPLEGRKPIELLAEKTGKDVVLQLDVGTCVHAGADPVAWINANKGRIRSIHCKEWSSDEAKGYEAALGEGSAPWKDIIQAAEKTGGIEAYLIEWEGRSTPAIPTVEKCLANFKAIRSGKKAS